jgi:hypothetical protein
MDLLALQRCDAASSRGTSTIESPFHSLLITALHWTIVQRMSILRSPAGACPSVLPSQAQFLECYKASFVAFKPLAAELEKISLAAWDAYSNHRKSLVTRG